MYHWPNWLSHGQCMHTCILLCHVTKGALSEVHAVFWCPLHDIICQCVHETAWKLQCELHNSWLLQTTYKGSLNHQYYKHILTHWNENVWVVLYVCMYMHVLCVVWASKPASEREGHSLKTLSGTAQYGLFVSSEQPNCHKVSMHCIVRVHANASCDCPRSVLYSI